MRAITYSTFGPPDQVLGLRDMARPDAGPGEVLVRLAYSGVNPSDAKARAGARPGVTKPAFPVVIPHSDGAGVIEAVGSGVESARIGQRVWIYNGQWQRASGTAAEYIALPAHQAVPMPDAVSLEVGATLGIPGLTATQAVFGGGDIAGQTLLISGGAGAVGHNAVQLAKWGGATVIATAATGAHDRVLAAGADHVLDYRDPDLARHIHDLTKGTGIDRAVEVEFGQNAAMLAEVMAPSATICAYGSGQNMTPTLPFGPFLFKALKLDILLIYILNDAARQAAITRLHAALTCGALLPAIQSIHPLEDCAKAQTQVMTPGRAGALLLNLT